MLSLLAPPMTAAQGTCPVSVNYAVSLGQGGGDNSNVPIFVASLGITNNANVCSSKTIFLHITYTCCCIAAVALQPPYAHAYLVHMHTFHMLQQQGQCICPSWLLFSRFWELHAHPVCIPAVPPHNDSSHAKSSHCIDGLIAISIVVLAPTFHCAELAFGLKFDISQSVAIGMSTFQVVDAVVDFANQCAEMVVALEPQNVTVSMPAVGLTHIIKASVEHCVVILIDLTDYYAYYCCDDRFASADHCSELASGLELHGWRSAFRGSRLLPQH